MPHTIDVSELTLVDLLTLKCDVSHGLVVIENDSFSMLCAYVETRAALVAKLEKALALDT